MEDRQLESLEYAADFERQQFVLYDDRRLAAETHANAVIAGAVTVAALVFSDFARTEHPALGWFIAAVVGLAGAFVLANVARVVSFETPRWRGGGEREQPLPSAVVKATLCAAREVAAGDPETLRERTRAHWRARAHSPWKLGDLKDRRLRQSLVGFLGPLAYFAARLLS